MSIRANYLVTIIFLALTLVGVYYVLQTRGIKPTDIDLSAIPMEVDDWIGKDIEISKRNLEILETEDVLMRSYVNNKGDEIYLLIVYSGNNRDAFHPPELCYLGGGTELLNKGYQSFALGDNGMSVNTNRLFMKDKYGKELAWYWFTMGDRIVTSFYKQQIYYTLDELMRKKTGGSMIRVSTRVAGDNVQRSETLAADFIKKIAPAIIKHLS